MDFTLFIAFAAASALLLAIPGPTILLVVAYALSRGRRAAFATIVGVALGDVTAITASMAGMSALLATSSELFTILKWIGALYLIWLGIKVWRAPIEASVGADSVDGRSNLAIALHCWLVTALNPKSIAFFVAFMPQFFDTTRPMIPQMTIMGVTFVGLAVVNALFYAFIADEARARVTRPGTMRILNRLGGTILIGAGLLTAAMRRS